MVYLLFALESNKRLLTSKEMAGIISCSLAIFSGFAAFWGIAAEKRGVSGWSLSSVFLVIGCFFMGYLYYIFYDKLCDGYSEKNYDEVHSVSVDQIFELRSVMQRTRKQQLDGICYLLFVFLLFPATFAFAWSGIISQETFLSVICVLSFVSKAMYCRILEHFHIEMIDPATDIVKKEREYSNSRRAFLRYVFHEVRVPLNSISMGLTLLRMNKEIAKDDLETVDMMGNAVDFMTETLNDVLSMQKIEDGKLELNFVECNIIQMAHKVYLTLLGQFESKKLVWKFVPTQDNICPLVLADRFRLEHVLTNLIGNAIKFSPPNGKITLKITREPLVADRIHEGRKITTLNWSIYDEGPGIKPEHQSLLFNAYSQIDANENQQGKGTGVGLTICKEIVEMHGGIIGVRSPSPILPPNQNRGCQFYFTLPLAVIDHLPDDTGDGNRASVKGTPAGMSSSASGNEHTEETDKGLTKSVNLAGSGVSKSLASGDIVPELNSFRALVVDDVKSNRMLLSMLLRKMNIAVDLADDGKTAIEMIEGQSNGTYNLIFIDNLMPIISGLDAVKILRSAPHCLDCLIIGLTGSFFVLFCGHQC